VPSGDRRDVPSGARGLAARARGAPGCSYRSAPALPPCPSVRLRPPVPRAGSFDHSTKVWDVATGRCLHTLSGHRGEISSTAFDFSGELCVTGSIDRTCKVCGLRWAAMVGASLRPECLIGSVSD
jgi:hypothetical protein